MRSSNALNILRASTVVLVFASTLSACGGDDDGVAGVDAGRDATVRDDGGSGTDATATDSGSPDAEVTDAPSPPADAPGSDSAMCVEEGGSVPVIPRAPPCCEGLAPISCTTPDPSGACPDVCAGAAFCARCGNGDCGPGENVCNCPADCTP